MSLTALSHSVLIKFRYSHKKPSPAAPATSKPSLPQMEGIIVGLEVLIGLGKH